MGAIIICRADEVFKHLDALHIAGVLSIEHPGAAEERRGAAPRLAASDHDAVPQKILTFWDSERPVPGGPDKAQVKAGLDFVMDHIAEGPVIIHCAAGKARSTALALGALSLINPEMKESELVDLLLLIRPQAAPNILVVEMVDEMTGRGGRLTQAVLDNPQISERRALAEESRLRMMMENPGLALSLFPEKTVRSPARKGPKAP